MSNLLLPNAGWCDVGRRRGGMGKVLMSYTSLELTCTRLVLTVATIKNHLVLNLE